MNTITVHCETVTPMFMAGADGKEPELRPPSIKGNLRFWWRAIHGNLSLKELRKREAAIFGGREKEQGRSKVIIHLSEKLLYDGRYQYFPLPHKTIFKLKAFSPGESFIVNLSLTENSIKINKEEIFNFDHLYQLFAITTILGGFGKRSRRGFGSVKIVSEKKEEINLSNILELLNAIAPEQYKIESSKILPVFDFTESSLKYPWIKQIQIGKKYNSYAHLLKRIGEATHKHCDNILKISTSTGRMASPVYVSVINNDGGYYPIITTLNTAVDKDSSNVAFSLKLQEKLKEAIL